MTSLALALLLSLAPPHAPQAPESIRAACPVTWAVRQSRTETVYTCPATKVRITVPNKTRDAGLLGKTTAAPDLEWIR